MPSVSKSQHALMSGVAHNPEFAAKVGIKQSVGREFVEADKAPGILHRIKSKKPKKKRGDKP